MGTITKQSIGRAQGSIEVTGLVTGTNTINITLTNGFGSGTLLLAINNTDTLAGIATKIAAAWNQSTNNVFRTYEVTSTGAIVNILGSATENVSSYNATAFAYVPLTSGSTATTTTPTGGGEADISILSNYTLYGSSINPVTETTLNATAVSPANVTININTPGGSEYGARNLVLELVGPNNGDQRIQLRVYQASRLGTLPMIPADTTLIDVGDIESSDSVSEVQTKIFTALLNSTAVQLISPSPDSELLFQPECGGAWTFSFLQNLEGSDAATCSIVDGVEYGTPGVVAQSGVRLTLGATGIGFNQTRLEFTENHWGISTQKRVFFFSDLSGTTSGWQTTTQTQNFAMRGDNTTITIAAQVAATISAWNANQDDDGVAMATSIGNPLWELVAVTGDDASFDIYPLDINDAITVPIFFQGRNDLNITIAVTTRDVNIQIPAVDPHRDNTNTLIRFIDNDATNFSQIAPFYVKTGEQTTWNMDNISIEFGAGFRFNNGQNANTVYNWDQVDILKTGDGQGNIGNAMFQNAIVSTLNWNNCTIKWYPLAVSSTLSAFMTGTGEDQKNIILNWDGVFIRYAGNSQMDYVLNFDAANSRIINSGLIGDGTSTALGPFFNPVVVTPTIRLLDPYSFIFQNRPIIFNANSSVIKSDTYTNSNFFVKTSFTGSGVDSNTIFTPFQNQSNFYKFLDFRVAGDIYENDAAFTNTTFANTGVYSGSLEYGVSFDPQYFNPAGDSLTTVRNEFRYGSITDVSELRVKEMFEAGPIGGASATISDITINISNLSVGDSFTIPRPNELANVILTAVSGTPTNSGNNVQFNIGTTVNLTIANMAAAFANTDLGVWLVNPLNSSLTVKRFLIGNNIGGSADIVTYNNLASSVSITLLETGAAGAGTNTHPFNNNIQYINNTDGLINTNTLTTNRYSANTSSSIGVGNNSGLFLTYNKTNYKNNTGGNSNAQNDIKPYGTGYTVYTKRPGFRPEIASFDFSEGAQTFSKILVTDLNWESVSKATVDAYTVNDMTDTNNVYRWIENETDDRTITNQVSLPTVYDRLIDFDNSVNTDGLINFNTLNYRVTRTGANPSYVSGSTRVDIPVSASLSQGNTVRGFTTAVIAELSGTLNLNNTVIDGLNVNIDSTTTTSLTGGIISAVNSNITNAEVNGTTFRPRSGDTNYTVTQSGTTEFDNVTMITGGTLLTDENDLHGLTGDDITIRYTGTTNFSIDSTATIETNITNSNIHFDRLTGGINWVINTDLSSCVAFNNISSATGIREPVTVILGENGILPTLTSDNNFVLARNIVFPGLTAADTINYRIERSSDGLLLNEDFTGVPGNSIVSFSGTDNVDIYLVRTNTALFKPVLLVNQTLQNFSISFETDTNVNSIVVRNVAITNTVEAYVDSIDLEVETVGRKFGTIVVDASTITTSSTITLTPDITNPITPTLNVTAGTTNTGGTYIIEATNDIQTATNIAAAFNRQNNALTPPHIITIVSGGNQVTLTGVGTNQFLIGTLETSSTDGLEINILTVTIGDLKIIVPQVFGTDSTPTSSSFWDENGGRGAGQYVMKLLEYQQPYAFAVLRNKTTLDGLDPKESQLIPIAPTDRLIILTKSVQLHSRTNASAVAFFPGQFIDDRTGTQLGPFSIIGVGDSINTPGGFVNVYQASSIVSPDTLALRIFADITAEEFDNRRVTRENMNNLGILAPINDNNPT